MGYLAGDLVWRQAWWAPFATLISVLVLHYISHWTLLDMTWRGRTLRRLLLMVTLYFVADIGLNRNYSLGSALRDTTLGVLTWHTLAKTLDVGLVFDLDGKPAPRWCVPEWKEEGKSEDLDYALHKDHRKTQVGLAGSMSILSWQRWQRNGLTKRPIWARQTNIIPRHWKLLDPPTQLLDQALWAADVTFLRRPGTSTLFAEEMRSLDWSKKKLEAAGEAQYKARMTGVHVPQLSAELQPFGYAETKWPYAFLDTSLVAWAFYTISRAHVPGETYSDFLALPLLRKMALTMCVGTMVAMPSSLPEMILIPLVQSSPFHMPATAIVPMFRDVGRSQSLSELWSWRWHAMSKRDFIRLARLMPFHNRAFTMLKVFFCSGVMHSMLLMRAMPPPSLQDGWSIVRVFCLPGTMGFFLSQAVFVLIEQALGPLLERRLATREVNSRPKAFLIQLARNAWVWSAMLLTGQLLTAELVARGLLTRDEIMSMKPAAQAHDYSAYFQRHLAPLHAV